MPALRPHSLSSSNWQFGSSAAMSSSARNNLDRHPNYMLVAYMASGT
jgi:hypothetical protein